MLRTDLLAGPAGLSPRWWRAVRVCICIGVMAIACAGIALPVEYSLAGLAGAAIIGISLLWPWAGLCLLSLSISWAGGFALPVAGFPLTATDVIIACLGAAWFVSSTHSKDQSSYQPWLPYLIGFLATIALSAVFAQDQRASLREIVKWAEVGVVFMATVRLVRGRRQLWAVVLALTTAGATQAMLGFVQFFYGLGPDAFRHGNFLRAYGTFDQPNPYAGFLNMCIPLALAGSLVLGSGPARTWCRLSVVMMGGALLISESRGALIAGMAAGVVVLAQISRPFARASRVGLFFAALAALLAQFRLFPTSPFQRVLNGVGLGGVSFQNVNNDNFSAVERAAHWLAGVRMFAAHPLLGVGIGNYEVAYPQFHPRGWYAALAHAHNYYINIAAEAGIVGLTAYLLLTSSGLWYSYAAKDRVRDTLSRVVVLGALGALVATSIHNLFDVLYVHGMAGLIGLLIGCVSVALAVDQESTGSALDR